MTQTHKKGQLQHPCKGSPTTWTTSPHRVFSSHPTPFSCQAPTVWNNLPQTVTSKIHSTSISSFKPHLKTHLFETYVETILYCSVYYTSLLGFSKTAAVCNSVIHSDNDITIIVDWELWNQLSACLQLCGLYLTFHYSMGNEWSCNLTQW